MTNIDLIITCNPALPPGKNVIKYHNNEIHWHILLPNTTIYPLIPPTLKQKYNVDIILVTYIVVNGNLSTSSILLKCAYGPRSNAKLSMNINDPAENDIANFCGRIVNIGIPIVNAKKKNNIDSSIIAQNACILHIIIFKISI